MPNRPTRAASGTLVTLVSPSRAGFCRALGQVLRGLLDCLLRWQARADERHHLAGLGERYLKDVGLTRAEVAPEIAKPFWQP